MCKERRLLRIGLISVRFVWRMQRLGAIFWSLSRSGTLYGSSGDERSCSKHARSCVKRSSAWRGGFRRAGAARVIEGRDLSRARAKLSLNSAPPKMSAPPTTGWARAIRAARRRLESRQKAARGSPAPLRFARKRRRKKKSTGSTRACVDQAQRKNPTPFIGCYAKSQIAFPSHEQKHKKEAGHQLKGGACDGRPRGRLSC